MAKDEREQRGQSHENQTNLTVCALRKKLNKHLKKTLKEKHQ